MQDCTHCDSELRAGAALIRHAERPLLQLSAAISMGDLTEARHWLEQVGQILGRDAQDEISLGRFQPQLAR